jgi:transcriptional regulator with XRE-family HTH domain
MPNPSPRFDALRARLVAACEGHHGRKSELARYLGVRPHMITEWLQGKEPRAESTLGILEWLESLDQ